MKRLLLTLLSLTSLLLSNDWKTATPPADNHDWVQTTSGEWLKGEIKGMYGDKLEFDSDEFDIQIIDLDDVEQLKSHSTTSLNIEGKGTIQGKLNVKGKDITLVTKDGNISIERSKVISLTNGADEEKSYWSGKISAGLSRSSGNTDKEEFNVKGNIKRQTSLTRFTANYLGNYGKNNGEETENNHRLHSNFDVFLTRHFFLRPTFAEYYRDTFQNVAQKYTYGIGAGYDIIATSKTDWTVFAGPAIQTTKFVAVEAGVEDRETTGAFIFATNYDHEIYDNIDFIAAYQMYLVNEKSGTYVHHALMTVETELVNDFDLDFTVIWDRVKDPVKRADGSLPEQDDWKSILSLGYSF